MRITTNNIPRDVIYGYELTDAERKEFDYIDWNEGGTFFRYKGDLFDLGEFMVVNNHPLDSGFNEWDGYHSDTFFSGILIKYAEDNERVIVGRYYV